MSFYWELLNDGGIESLCKVIRDLTAYRRANSWNDYDSALMKRASKALIGEWSASLSVSPRDAEMEYCTGCWSPAELRNKMQSEEKTIITRVVENFARTGNTEDEKVKVTSLPQGKTSYVEYIGQDGRSIMLDEYRVDGKVHLGGLQFPQRDGLRESHPRLR